MNWTAKLRSWLPGSLRSTQRPRIRPESLRVVVTAECLEAISKGIDRERAVRHEGVVYLLGLTDGAVTLIAGAVRPIVTTTVSSFDVSSQSMAAVMRVASNASLHMVGQLHTHPGAAYHSAGDETGARIRFPGFTSIVVPSYGDELPDMTGIAIFMVNQKGTFQEICDSSLIILPAGALWRT